MKYFFLEMTTADRVEILFEKSRRYWLTQSELKELIGIRDAKVGVVSEIAGDIVKDQNDKMCGRKHW